MNNNWIASSGSSWSVITDWSLGHVPTTDEIAIFASGFSNQACTINQNVNCSGITISGTYTASWSSNAYDLTVTAGINFSGTGALILSNSNINSGGDIFIASTVGTLNPAACNVTMSGTSNWTNNKGGGAWGVFTVAENSTVEMNGSVSSQYFYGAPPLVIGNNSTFTLNQPTRWYTTSDGACISLPANYTLAGAQPLNFLNSVSGLTLSIPTISGTIGGCSLYNGAGSVTYNQSGVIAFSTSSAVFNVKTLVAGNIVFNTNNYNITGGNLNCGCVTAGDTVTVNLGSSVLNFRQMGNLVTGYSAGTCYFNMSTCQMTFGGNLTIRDWMVVDAGASLITFSGSVTNSQLIVATGQALYDIVVNKTSASMTHASNVSCHNFTISATNTGGFVNTDYVITANGNITLDGSSTLNLGNGLTLNGASSTLTIGASIGTYTAASCIYTFNTVSGVFNNNKSSIVGLALTIGDNDSLTYNSAGSFTITTTGSNSCLNLGNNSSYYQNGSNIFRKNSAGAIIIVGSGCYWTSTGNVDLRNQLYNNTAFLPSFTKYGVGNVLIRNIGILSTINLSGDISVPEANIEPYTSASGIIFNANTFSITCKDISYGGEVAAGECTYNFGSSIINCNTVNMGVAHNTGISLINLQSSTWNCSGNYLYRSTHTINPGTSIVNITNTSTVTSADKDFNNLNINTASGNIITFTGSPKFSGNFNVIEGSTNLSNLNWSGYGNVSFSGTGANTIGSGIYMGGSNKYFGVGSGLGAVTSAGCVITAPNDTDFLIDKSITINRLSLGSGHYYRFRSANA